MTVLANEQVIDGRGWRSGAPVERRKLAQWFLKITDFADELLDGLGDARPMARQGPADAGELDRQEPRAAVPLPPRRAGRRRSTRSRCSRRGPDTIFGASFVAIAADHPIAQAVAASDPEAADVHRRMPARRHQRSPKSRRPRRRAIARRSRRSIRSIPDWRLPVYIANFVLMDYGTGAMFGVARPRPARFRVRDAISICRSGAWSLPSIDEAAQPVGGEADVITGITVNSQFLDGLTTEQAIAEVIRRAEDGRLGPGHRPLPPARLGRVAPALLGHADPDHPLRNVRRGSGAAPRRGRARPPGADPGRPLDQRCDRHDLRGTAPDQRDHQRRLLARRRALRCHVAQPG